MKKILLTLLIGGTVGFISCNTSEDPGEQNQNPSSFTITTDNITSTTADLNWSVSTDPDGDDVTYSLEGSTGFTGSEVFTSTSITGGAFSGLVAETAYAGSVIADDGNGGSTSASFSFTTIESDGSNQAPGSFSVTVGTLSNSSADLSWTASADPDGDNVTYEIELQSTSLETGVTATVYELEELSGGVEYAGKVIASDGNGGTTEVAFTLTTYVIDISLYQSMDGFVSATLVDCNYSEGGSGTCYSIVFSSNNIDDDGPFCPETTSDTGGLGNYNGDGLDNGSATNGDAVGLSRMNAALFTAMENDGYDVIDNSGNIRVYDFTGMPNNSFGYCLEPVADDNITLTFEIPVYPTDLSSPDDIDNVEYIGLAFDGVPINGEPPLVAGDQAMGEGQIPSLDRCGGHHDPSGYYHWHFIAANMNATLDEQGLYEAGVFECTHKTQSSSAIAGFARDGYPIYSATDDGQNAPTDLDACNGHTAVTAEYPEGIYHYHASNSVPNVPPCVVGKQSVAAFNKPQ